MRKTFRWFRRCCRRAPVPQRIPILAYHGANAHGYDYATNDHRALESDLATARKLGFRVATLRDVVDFVLGRASTVAVGRWLALTFDDAPDVDWFDFVHPASAASSRSIASSSRTSPRLPAARPRSPSRSRATRPAQRSTANASPAAATGAATGGSTRATAASSASPTTATITRIRPSP